MTQVQDARVVQYELEVEIHATPERVWRGLTDQLTQWWLPSYHMLGDSSVVTLEMKAGGRLYEQDGSKELLWYTVLAIDPMRSIDLVGYCTPQFGGPATTMLTLSLESSSSSVTTLKVSDALYGAVSDATAKSLHSGWTELFTDGLKRFLENP